MTTPTPEALADSVIQQCRHTPLSGGISTPGEQGACVTCIALAFTEQARNARQATWEAMREFIEQQMALDPEHPTIGPLFDIGWENAREVMLSRCRARAAAAQEETP